MKIQQKELYAGGETASDMLVKYGMAIYFITGLLLSLYNNTSMTLVAAGIVLLLACYCVKKLLPGINLYQYLLSAAAGVFTEQFAYQSKDILALHFGSCIAGALLVTYRNWRLQLPLAAIIIAQYAISTFLPPTAFSPLHINQTAFVLHSLLSLQVFAIFGYWAYHFEKSWLSNKVQHLEMLKLQEACMQNASITELSENLRQSNDLLSQANHELEIIFKSIEAVIFSYDCTQHRFKHISAACEKIFGFAPGEFMADNQLWCKMVHSEDRPASPVFDRRHWNGKPLTYQYRVTHKNGTVRWMETKLVPTTNANGGLLRIDGICNDITARIELETALAAEIKEKQREITAAVITAQENERYFLGEELHDNINPILSTARLYIDCVLSGDERQQHLLSESKDFIGTAINEIRTLSKSLIPPSLGDIGLVEAMEDMVNNIRAVNKLVFITDFDTIDDNLLSRNLKLTIFRIVQEQLNNIMKHANAKTVWVRLNYNAGKLRLTVKDDGIGFDTKLKRNGVGLQNITSRTELCNGNVSVTASPGMGCELTASFTLDTSQNCIEIGLRA